MSWSYLYIFLNTRIEIIDRELDMDGWLISSLQCTDGFRDLLLSLWNYVQRILMMNLLKVHLWNVCSCIIARPTDHDKIFD